MIYNEFCGKRVSRLGMGNMRLPTTAERGPIDREAARKMILDAYAAGVNYFDTAFRYHNGESEPLVGEVLSELPRDSFYLATKLPGHMMNYKDGKLGFQGYLAGETIGSISEIFESQLQRCRVDYFDFYLMHNVCDSSFGFYTNGELGVVPYLLEQKRLGRIRHLGFSTHARKDTLEKFLDLFPAGTFEFVQMQLNYLDWRLQDAKGAYELLTSRGIPVIVMEPCRGGSLAKLDEEDEAAMKALRPDDSIASWAFRFVASLENVKVCLSGMTKPEQLADNVKTFSAPSPLSPEEAAVLDAVIAKKLTLVPCTGCSYCTEGCPQSLNIPKLISMYNEASNGGGAALSFMLQAMGPDELPSACIGCGSCMSICPQGIAIPDIMTKFADILSKR